MTLSDIFNIGFEGKCKGESNYMIKTYVIDTNVLIQAPYALECFEDNNLVLPLVVLEELDGLKKAEGEKGANTRAAVRKLEGYRQKGALLQGVKLDGGGILRIEKNFVNVELPSDLPDDNPDNRILKVCMGLADTAKDSQVILVIKDIVLRLKAQILGMKAEDFERERVSDDDAQYTGRTEVYFSEDMIKEFKKKGISLDDTYQSDEDGNRSTPQFHENEFVILKTDQSSKKTLLGRVSGGRVVPLVYKKSKPYGVSPRNDGQYFMQEALMTDADTAPLVIIKGMAGTAKTFYALAVGMEKVYNNPSKEYRRIIVCRSNAQFDDDIGFLPGDEKEKIAPLMRPVIDNLEQILDSDEKERYEDEAELSDKITYGEDVYINCNYMNKVKTVYTQNTASYMHYIDSPTSVCKVKKFNQLDEIEYLYEVIRKRLEIEGQEELLKLFTGTEMSTAIRVIIQIKRSGEKKKKL